MGRNVVERMKDGGIAAKKGTTTLVPIDDIWAPPKGHPLYSSRADEPIDEELCADIAEKREIENEIIVRDDGIVDDKRRLTLVDGARRTTNGREVQRRFRKSGILTKTDDNPTAAFYVKVEFFKGDDIAVLRERLRRNDDPLKKRDALGVLSLIARQLVALKAPIETIVEAMPKGIEKREVEALLDWPNLLPDVAARFDAGASVIYLRSVLDAPREKQGETLTTLEASGAKDAAAATRALRKKAAETSAPPAGDKPRVVTPVLKPRARSFTRGFRESVKKHSVDGGLPPVDANNLLDFLLGDDRALDPFPAVKQAAIDAGWKP